MNRLVSTAVVLWCGVAAAGCHLTARYASHSPADAAVVDDAERPDVRVPDVRVPDATDGNQPDLDLPRCGASLPCLSSLTEDFEGGALDPTKWQDDWMSTGCTAEVRDGQLQITPPAGVAEAYCYVLTVSYYDMTRDAVAVQVVRTLDQVPGTETIMAVEHAQRVSHYVTLSQGLFSFWLDGQLRGSAPFDPDSDRWWRLRDTGTAVVLETSFDGLKPWIERLTSPSQGPNTEVWLRLGAGVHLPVADPGTAVFDCVNLAVSCP